MSFVYIATSDRWPDRIKIGKSRNPTERARQLSGSAWGHITIRHVVEFSENEVSRREQGAHNTLRHCALGYEWFEATPSEGLWAIYYAARRSAYRDRLDRRPWRDVALPFGDHLGRWGIDRMQQGNRQ